MTAKNRTSKNKKPEISELMTGFENVCRSNGLRITYQRLEIFRELAKYPGHPTVEKLYGRVRRRLKMISLDTVYRTIATFEKHGLIKRVQLLDNSTRLDINLSVHHHLVCVRCKSIEDFYWPDFDRMRLPGAVNSWGEVDARHAEIRGLCRKCARALKK